MDRKSKSDQPRYLTDLWRKDARRYKPLSQVQINALLDTLRGKASAKRKAEAREQLICSFLPLACAFMWRRRDVPAEDVIGVANLTVVKVVDNAIAKFDTDREGKLSTFLYRAIQLELLRYADQTRYPVYVPTSQADRKRTVSKARGRGSKGLDPSAISPQDIATDTGLPVSAVMRVDALPTGVSLDDTAVRDKDGDESTFIDVIPSPAPTPEEIVSIEEGREILRGVLYSQLTDDQYLVMVRKSGLEGQGPSLVGDPLSEPEIASELKFSQRKVKHLRVAALKRLRAVPGLRELLQFMVRPSHIVSKYRIVRIPPKAPSDKPRHEHGPGNTTKLSPEQVRQIRAAIKAGVQQRVLAKRYGVSDTAISGIKLGKTWKDVK